jgi:transcriptional regulator PpsR
VTADLSALSELAPELAATLVSVASDIALVIDEEGVIVSIAQTGEQPLTTTPDKWVGRRWAETVTSDTRQKIVEMLKEVAATGLSRARQVNHTSATGTTVPITYTAVRLGERGPLLAVGRDLRAISALQQRIVETQQAMERDYWRKRRTETRYQLLFQVASDAIVVIDAATQCVVDANRAATQLFGLSVEALSGKPVSTGFDPASQVAVGEMLAATGAQRGSPEILARFAGDRGAVRVSATPFRGEGNMLLMRVRAVEENPATPETTGRLVALVHRTPDAIVITDSEGRVCMANPAFLRLVQADREASIIGHPLSDWIGRPGSDLPLILSIAKQEGVARPLMTLLRGQHGKNAEVELSATHVPTGSTTEFIGFIIRVVNRPASAGSHGSDQN